MSRRGRLITALVTVVVAATATGGGLAYATGGRGAPEHSGTHPSSGGMPLKNKPVRPLPGPRTPPWQILESGSGARSLLILVNEVESSAGCAVGGKATATETATTIRLHVTEQYARAQACTADYHPFPVWVALRRPINGREIEGAGLKWPTGDVLYLTTHTREWVIARVPRVIGFAAGQAVLVLRAQGFHGEPANSTGTTVIAQSPGRGQVPTDSNPSHQFFGTVKLATGA